MEFWETFDAKEIVPYLSSVDNRLRDILAVESGAASADSVAADTVAVAQASAISAADSLAADVYKRQVVISHESCTRIFLVDGYGLNIFPIR